MARLSGMEHKSKDRFTPYGKWSDTCRAALDLTSLRLALYIIGDGNGGETEENAARHPEPGPEITIGISRRGKLMYFSLSSLTHAELYAAKEFFDIAFANALPIVEARDRFVQEALENGDDSFVRLYRRIPELLIREGQKWRHYPKLRRGLEWVTEVAPSFGVRVQNVRGGNEPVLERDSKESESSDSKPQDSDVS